MLSTKLLRSASQASSYALKQSHISRVTKSATFLQRNMASSTTPLREWLVIIPDHQDMLEKRIEIRTQHLQTVQPKVENDMVRLGGATLGAPLEEGQPAQMTGSAFVIRGDTEQEVREFLEKDIYFKSGVWNLAKASFIPFRTAVRSPN